MASEQPLLVTATVQQFEIQPAVGMSPMPPGAPEATVAPAGAPLPQQGGMGNLQISVPSGCQAGQSLQFTPPGHAQPMSVVMQQEVPPGSVVTVQYPTVPHGHVQYPTGLQGVAQQGHAPMQYNQPGALPPMQLNMEEDITGRNLGWGLYLGGVVCCFIPFAGPFFSIAMWGLVACMYFCKPPAHRSQLPQSRTPALVAVVSGGVCCVCQVLAFFIILFVLIDCQTIDNRTGEPSYEGCGALKPYLPNDPYHSLLHTYAPPAPPPSWPAYPMAAGFEVKSMDTSVHV